MSVSPSINDYIGQVRLRVETAERKFQYDLRSLHSSQAARGTLRSGATISKTLRTLEEQFALLTDDIIAYLGKAVARTTLSRDELLRVTSSMLSQSLLGYKAMVDREKLLKFAAGKGIEQAIDESFARADQRLAMRLQEFDFGLDDAAPNTRDDQQTVPASDRYVTLVDNQKAEISGHLVELKEIVRGDNEVDEESKQIALSELAVFEATIAAPRIATDLVERFVKRVVKWIALIFGGALVAETAHRLVQALLPLLGA